MGKAHPIIDSMKRHKFPRLKQSFTIQGLSPGEILLSAASFYLGYRLGGMVTGSPLLKIGAGITMAVFVLPRIKERFNRYPPGWFNNWLKWLSSKDIYYPLPDESVMPIISYDIRDDEAHRAGIRGEAGLAGEHPESAAAPGHR